MFEFMFSKIIKTDIYYVMGPFIYIESVSIFLKVSVFVKLFET